MGQSSALSPAVVLDADQRRVVEHGGGPLLVLAGPGTGKTTTMVEAIAHQIEDRGVSPEQILALTFSRKAAEQLRERVVARVGRTMSSPVSSTFHSFAYGLVRQFSPAELYAEPLRLLSAPEQDVVLGELLRRSPEAVRWPASLAAAVGTRGFTKEIHAVIARAQERNLDPVDLVELGEREGNEAYIAAGWFLQQYLDVMDAQGAIDYPSLISRAVQVARDHQATLRARYRHVFVDEYQDTDPAQVELLQALAGEGRNLTVVGDPDQSIYGFRGADVRGILDFPAAFLRADGSRAPVIALSTTRRFGPRLLRASREIASGITFAGSIPAEAFARFRDPACAPTEPGESRGSRGVLQVRTFDTARAETEHIADLLRRAHLEDGVSWDDMAVLVRSGRSTIPALRRALAACGVPVDVAGDETPLSREPAVQALLRALAVVVHAGLTDVTHPDYVGADQIRELLTSPLGAIDATELRALGRALKSVTPDADQPVHELLRQAVLEPGFADGVSDDLGQVPGWPKLAAIAGLITRARDELADQSTPEELLWLIWSGTSWPQRLRASALAGGPAARFAHRDLDAVVALFDQASRAEQRRGHTSVGAFLELLAHQEIPADTLSERGIRGSAVRLLTAHRSKGLEWQLVVVAGVQEGGWPDLRRRNSLLQADRLDSPAHGLREPTTARELLAEERRLFYVACTRARQRLVVTAVRSPDDDGEQPSRFLSSLVPLADVRHDSGRPQRPLSMAGLVADLRRTLADPEQPEPLRAAAARRLAIIARTEIDHRPIASAAHPRSWWGLRAPSESDVPVRPGDRPLSLSPSLVEAVLTCPAKWFLEREAGGAQRSSASQAFGNLVHAAAEHIATGTLPDEPEAALDALMPLIDEVWGGVAFRTPWSRQREYDELRAALQRLLAWHQRADAREVVATEVPLRAEVQLPDGRQVVLNGFADRVELDLEGRVVIVDLKTGKYPPSDKSLPDNAQLGLYQWAVDNGAADDLVGPGARSGGGELWQLRKSTTPVPKVQVQEPQTPGPDGLIPIERQVAEVAETLGSERFVARPSAEVCKRCSFQAMCPTTTPGSVMS